MIDNDIPCLPAGTVLTGSRQYTIESVIGAGGFGITYMALTEVVLGNMRVTTRVAVKEHFLADHNEREASTLRVTTPGTVRSRKVVADSLRDFLGEARRLQSVSAGQKAIVKVNEVFEANGTAYYVMEYLEGSSLWDAVAGRGMAEGDMLALMQPIIEAVAYLHANRLTHLDIKPQNIMLATEGAGVRPVLIDFGLSKHYDEQGRATSTINTLACSDGYSPAEQYSGITTFTPAADVYALGATMIACLTGQTPPKSTEWSVGDRLRYVDSMNISEPLREALRGALADPANRLPDASALANIFANNATRNAGGEISFQGKRSAIINLPTPRMVPDNPTRLTSASPKPAGKNRLSIALIALAAIAVGFGAYFAFRSNPTPQPAPAVDTAAIAQTLETEPIVVDNSAAEAAAAAEAERQRLAEQERQRQEEAERQRLAEQERQRQEEAERQRLAEQERQRQEEAERQRREEEQRRQVWQNHRTPRNLYLAVDRGGNQYYFSESDWNSLPAAQKNECRKLGVVIKKDGQEFILALNHESGEYTWHEAMSRFGNRLPTKQQGEAWKTQQEAVQRAVRAFGGNMPGPGDTYHSNVYNRDFHYSYWTRTEYDSSLAWGVTMHTGYGYLTGKTTSNRVRAVAPVPVASAI